MPVKPEKDGVEQYIHDEQKRLNNPPVGLVTAETDHLNGKKTYQFDPHLDPQLQWAGKAEGLSFDVDTVSLHVHERIDPLTIIETVKKKEATEQKSLFHYFESKENNPPIREAIQFYKHSQGWSNRLIAGDSLIVMNSLLEKEGMAGKIQMIYIDPPYGIKYSSNFQPFVGKREVKDKDEDLTQEPETIKAFRDTWELEIHSYLTYLQNRLLLARELLTESGSVFVQISAENMHLVRNLLDEVFGKENFCSVISFVKTSGQTTDLLSPAVDYLLWYAKEKKRIKYHRLFTELEIKQYIKFGTARVEMKDGTLIPITAAQREGKEKLPNGRLLRLSPLDSQTGGPTSRFKVEFEGQDFYPPGSRGWSTTIEGFERLRKLGRLAKEGKNLRWKRYLDENPYEKIDNIWMDTSWFPVGETKTYVVQTASKVISRCILMTTDPGDIVFDPTCGSGTTAFCAEKWGRRWITCDTSRVAVTLAKQRFMTADYEYFELRHPKEGIQSGFNYVEAPHITLKAIANNEPIEKQELYDQPVVDDSKIRITGPFTVEAVPSQRVRSFDDVEQNVSRADNSVSRSGETQRQNDWISAMLSSGIRGKGGQILKFSRIELLGGTKWIHAEAVTENGKQSAISFGPMYAPLEQRQVELAIEEAQQLVPKPKIVIFASFEFDPEAAKDIDELRWPGVDVLKAKMDNDLFTADLKKKNRAGAEVFWLLGQPDIEIKKKGDKYYVVVNGFDYYNTKTGDIESGDTFKIAMWELDTDYDGRSLYPRQVFFPMAGSEEGWSKLTKTLKAQIDEERIESYRGNTSLPFKLGNNKQVAVKIVDDRGIESLKIIRVR